MVVYHVAHASRTRKRRDDDRGNAHTVCVEFARGISGLQFGRDFVGLRSRRRCYMVVITAVLVIGVDEQRSLPRRRAQHGFDDFVRPQLAEVHVLRVLLGLPGRNVFDVCAEEL